MSLPTSPLGLPTPGARHPRVDTHPPYEASFGPESIALAQVAGLWLDPWQQDSLTTMVAIGPDRKWVCFECAELLGRQNGKGSVLEARVLAGFVLFGEKLILWSAHEYKTAIEMFLRIKQLIRNLIEAGELDEDDIKVIHGGGEQGFERLSTGQRIKFVSRSKDSGRGFSGDLVIIDEAFAYTPIHQSALMPTMSARPNPQIVYASTPPLTGSSGEVLYALRHRGDPTAPRSPDDPPWEQDSSLAYRDWGLGGDLDNLDNIDLADPELWAATNPAAGVRITMQFIQREFRAMSREDFARERLGIWPRQITGAAGAIPDELWRDLAVEQEEPPDVAFAVVVNHKRTHTAIAAVGQRSDGRLQVEIVAYQPGTHWVVEKVKALKERWSPVGIACQDRGPSSTLIDPLEAAGITRPDDRDEPVRCDLAVPFSNDVATAYGMTVDALKQRTLVHLDEAPLNVAVAAAGTRPLGGGTTWDFTCDGAELLQALSLAYWLYVTWLPLVTVEYDPLANIG